MAKNDKLEIRMKFNGKKITLSEDGETAGPTFRRILELFAIDVSPATEEAQDDTESD